MKFDLIAELNRLASILETKADSAGARAQEHAKAQEIVDATKESKREARARHFVQVCRDASRRLAIKAKRAGFIPPTWEEVLDHCREKFPLWPHADILSWFNHFESCGWKIGQGKQMVNWKSAASNGFGKWKEKNPQRAAPTFTTTAGVRAEGDPEGWPEFLKGMSRPYKQYRYEQEWVRSDFNKSKRPR